MRKFYAALFLLFAFFLSNTKSEAQVNLYSFVQSNTTYTEITGGSVLGTTSSDDQYFVDPAVPAGGTTNNGVGFPIGFNFTYNGATFDRFGINNNGWIALGQSTLTPSVSLSTTSAYTPLSSTATVTPSLLRNRIAGMGRDLQAQTGAELRFETIGSAPNRQLVIQFKNYKRFGTAGTGDNFNFQIILYETSNVVQVKYGSYVFNTTTTTSSINHVGLGGSDATDFNNRQTTVPHDWNVTTAGTANTQGTQNATSTITVTPPASGLTFTWIPPGPCVPGSLVGGTTQGPAGPICSGGSAALSVTGASSGTGLTFLWESSPNGTTWNTTGVTTATLTANVLTSTYFRRRITCSGTDQYSTPFLVNVSAPSALPLTEGFNTSGTTVFPACWSQQILTGTGNITFQTSTSNPATIPLEGTRFVYWNSFSISNNSETRLVSPGIATTGTSSVDVRFFWYNENNPTYSTGAFLLEGVQVQYSLDGITWVDAGALIPRHDASLAAGTGQWKSKIVTLPAAAGNQSAILVAFKFHSSFGDNCSMDAVSINATPTCAMPTGLGVSALTSNSVTLTWTAASPAPSNGYRWEVRTSGLPGSGAAGLAASGTTAAGVTTANVTGLTGFTNYDYYVLSDCGGGASGLSYWTAAFRFMTLCDPTTLPYLQNFSTYATTFPPQCWSRNNATFLTGVASSAFGVGAGSAKFDFYNASAGTQLDLVSPEFTPVPSGYFLVFDHAYATFISEVDQLQILYSTNAGASYTNLITYAGGTGGPLNTGGASIPSFTPLANQWATKIIALPAGTNKITFRGVSAFGNNLYIDNVILTSCTPPTGLTAAAPTPTTAVLNWTASTSNPSGGYQWEVRSSGAPGSGATGLAASGTTAAGTTTANASGLVANTTYSFYVRSDCGGGDLSVWGGPIVFTTPCNPAALPILETFTTATFPPPCWTRNNTTFLLRGTSSAFGVGTGSARYNFWAATSGTFDLKSLPFNPVPSGYFLMFDHAYATFSGEVDQLQILYSTNGGVSYSNLITYLGGATGPLNTGGVTLNPFASFVPTSSQWASKVVALPVGTNSLIFRGISAFGDDLFLDNILITSCLPPTGLGLSAIAPTTATLSWTGSVSNPSSGYQWEVRTSGAAGSGATGLTASGTTAAGVTTANVTGLTPFTAYNYYVRSDCGGGDLSIWAGPYAFTTPCNPIAVPFAENFATYATTFPPNCWLRNNATYVTGQAATAYGVGLGSAKFDFYNAAAGTQLDLISPLFNPTPAGWGLVFDHAYATFAGEVDSLRIMYSTNGGGSYSYLTTYAGGGGGPLNTGGAVLPAFSPTSAQWGTKAIVLPAGTNRLLFKGISAFGNNLFLDNIAIVSCLPPNNVKALGISPTEIAVSFVSPGSQFIVEYGPVGFTPGTGAAAGGPTSQIALTAGPSIILGATPLPALTPNTTYDIYVRQVCSPTDFSINVKTSATTLCTAVNVPYLQNFESAVVPAMPSCTSLEDVNGNSGSFWFGSGGGSWETYTDANPLTYVSPTNALLYFYDFNDLSRGGDDWFYTQGLNLTAGTTYRLKFFYKALDGVNWPESMEVKYGTKAYAPYMTSGTLFTNNNISSTYSGAYDSVQVEFTPTSTGVFYLGFHVTSPGDRFGILMDDISLKVAPVVDMGATGLVLPSMNCPTSNVFVQATIKNYNLTPINFATYPITVTSSITGAATGTVSTVLNTGTLAPNASMTVYLSPAFNFTTGGVYNFKTYTSSTFDSEPQNDTAYSSVNVNPNPATPVITPSSLQLCAGSIGQLSTQFTASPPPVTLPAVASGTISVGIPDATPAGANHSLNVTTVPVGATVTGISVTVNVTHTWIGDVIINLRAPNGNVLNLINQKGGSGDNLLNTVFSSTATIPVPATGAPYTGTYLPDGNAANPPTAFPQTAGVTTFAGLMSVGNGAWTLALRDNAGLDVGTLTSWSITITYQIVTPTITWTPTTGLYTNSTGTAAYTGGNAFSVYAGPAATTTYTVTATTPAGCTSSATALVTVNPIPVITVGSIPDTVCISDPVIQLPVTPVGGNWSGVGVSGNTFVPPATAVGTYTLTYTYVSPAGCPATATKKISVKDCPERMILLRDNAVILYPNPNTGRFNIRINSVLYNNLGMRVYTNEGTLVRTQQFSGLAWGLVIPIDLTNLPGGLYMVKFYYEGGPRTAEKTFKVIIGTE